MVILPELRPQQVHWGKVFSNAVGMAIAEKMLASQFNQDELNIVNHFTYVFAGDGCLMGRNFTRSMFISGYFGAWKVNCFL